MNRFAWLALLTLASLVLALAGCDPGAPSRVHRTDAGHVGGDGGGSTLADADGDGIPDVYEGRSDNTDTDGDGTPDYLDDDSDLDGIPDSTEGGAPGAMPVDSDHDGTPDFRDADSDGNGILDMVEGTADPDGDGQGNYRDTDDDGDVLSDVSEIGPSALHPIDTDADGTPDFRDTDSENDTIGDHDEGVDDTDHDMIPDRFDDDSDGDGLTDAQEAGDTDVATRPADTDADGTPDFRDTDSDGDGLSDAAEVASGTSPTHADTDGDGVSDLVEVASHTDPMNPADSPRTHGNFVFVEPYMMPPDPLRDTLDFATNIRSADVYFLIDTTGSMGSSISSVQSSLSTSGSGIIDQIRSMIPDTNFGVADFKDAGDPYVFRHVRDISADATATQAGVNSLSASGGGDTPEGDVPSLWMTATGIGTAGAPSRSGCPAGTFGYPCFRMGSVPIVVLITDAPFHNGSAALAGRAPPTDGCSNGSCPYGGYTDYAMMLPELVANHIRVIGVAVTTYGDWPVADETELARDTGAVDLAGTPLVSQTPGGAVSSAVIDAVRTLANGTRFDISIRYQDDPADSVDTFAAFVARVEANTAGDPARGCAARSAIDTNGDSVLDTFPDVVSGQRVCFDIIVKQNDTVMPTTMPQIFQASLHVIGDGFTELDQRAIYFLVPPTVPPPGGPM
jgi:hypothetical protein